MIFLNLLFPEISGLEVLLMVKMYDWTKSVPIIIILI